jgi:hypothetical protein
MEGIFENIYYSITLLCTVTCDEDRKIFRAVFSQLERSIFFACRLYHVLSLSICARSWFVKRGGPCFVLRQYYV